MFRIAVLDACVLYPVVLRDFFITLANAKLYEQRWTHAIGVSAFTPKQASEASASYGMVGVLADTPIET